MQIELTQIKKTAWRHRSLLYTGALFIVLVSLFGLLADEVIEGDTLPYDEAVLQWVRSTASPTLDTLFVVGTDIGGVIGVAVIGLLLASYFTYKKRWNKLLFVAFSLIGAVLLNVLLKFIFVRDRPDLWVHLVEENSYSFPSGHAMASSAFAVMLGLLGWRTTFRWWIIAGAAIFAFFIGYSRLYLGVHYPSDVLAGWLVSAAWVSAVHYTMRHPRKNTPAG